MRNIVIVIVSALIIVTGCQISTNDKLKQKYNDIKLKERNSYTEAINENGTLPLTITKIEKDLDYDGKNESINVLLINGEKDNSGTYKGDFVVQLLDENNRLVNQIEISSFTDVCLPDNFPILFKDYNGDGTMEFNIGYLNTEDSKEYIYHFYTIAKTGQLKELKIRSYESVLRSCYRGNSYDFNQVSNDTFLSYEYKDDAYVYEMYCWDENSFVCGTSLDSQMDIDKIDIEGIQKRFKQIKADLMDVSFINEKEILDKSAEAYEWILNHSEEAKVYLFMCDNNSDEIKSIIRSKLDKSNWVYSHFSEYFKVNVLNQYTIEDIKNFQPPQGYDDYKYKEYNWLYDDINYKLLVGYFHLSDFVLVFDENGLYLDGFLWTDKSGENTIKTIFRTNQNYVDISPVLVGSGTGEHHEGGIWFEIYKNHLLRHLIYPMYGYEAAYYEMFLTSKYKLLSSQYNSETNKFDLTYQLSVTSSEDNPIKIEKTVSYPILYEDEHYYIKLNSLFSSETLQQILEENYDKIDSIIDLNINKQVEIEYEEDISQITVFLLNCDVSQERNDLLKKACKLYLNHPELHLSSDLTEKINSALGNNKDNN